MRGRGHEATTLRFAHTASAGMITTVVSGDGVLELATTSVSNQTTASDTQSVRSVKVREVLDEEKMA